jgi:hypothetical protein
MDLNEKHKDLFIPQWFDKSHFESFLDTKLTDEQFSKLKYHLLDGSGDYLADSISETVSIILHEIKESFPEILK